MPFGSPRTSKRRSAPRNSRRPAASRSNGRSSSSPTAIVASAFCRLWRPGTFNVNEPSVTVDSCLVRGSADPALHRGADRQRPEYHVHRGDIRVRSVDAVRDHATSHAGNDRRKVRVVGAGDDGAEKRDLVGEIDERLLEVVESAVALEVFIIDVRNHRNCRKQLEKTPVALVRLRDHQLAASQARVAAEGAEPPADHRRRIQPGAFQHQRDHRRRRRFPVRARDRDAVAQPHELGEHLGARNDGDLPPLRFDDLGVRRPNRRRDHDDVGAPHVLRRMPVRHLDAQGRSGGRSPSTAWRRNRSRRTRGSRAARRSRSCRCRRYR